MQINITVEPDEDVLEGLRNKGMMDEEIESISRYAKWFDNSCFGWTKNPEYNLAFLKAQQNYANELLRAKGHLFLNDVYKKLGIKETTVGQVVGWIYDEKNIVGDNFVDFGLTNTYNADFINGNTPDALLDFNVDGWILDRI